MKLSLHRLAIWFGSLRPRYMAGPTLVALAGVSLVAWPGGGASAHTSSLAFAHRKIPSGNWTQFGYNDERSGVGPSNTGINPGNLKRLSERVVRLPGTVDSAPVELHAVKFRHRRRDVVIVTTSYGITVALDPGSGHFLWKYTPRGTSHLEHGPQFATASPIIDPDHRFVYTASPNGVIHKLRISNGHQVWGTSITHDPRHEKMEGALNIEGSEVLATTGGYVGDIPVYQGHLVTINRKTGAINHVFNSLCSNRHHLINPPSSCPVSDSALLARAGTVIEPHTGNILIATGNAPFNGSTDWGDSVLELSPRLRLLHNWTPTNQAYLNDNDVDLGSTEPALLPAVDGLRLAVQGGKDGRFKLLNLNRLDGTTHGAGPRTGGQLQTVKAPGPAGVFTQPAVWQHDGHTYMFGTTAAGTTAYELGADHRLHLAWQANTAGTSPVLAGGLLYVFDQVDGQLLVRRPVSGQILATLPAASGHWNSPIVVGGRIILPVGNDNDQLTSGRLIIYHLPGR